jgi:hypothetical protein
MLPEKLTAEEVTAAAKRAVADVELPAAFTDMKLPNMDSISSKIPPLPALPAGWELPKARRERESFVGPGWNSDVRWNAFETPPMRARGLPILWMRSPIAVRTNPPPVPLKGF